MNDKNRHFPNRAFMSLSNHKRQRFGNDTFFGSILSQAIDVAAEIETQFWFDNDILDRNTMSVSNQTGPLRKEFGSKSGSTPPFKTPQESKGREAERGCGFATLSASLRLAANTPPTPSQAERLKGWAKEEKGMKANANTREH